MPRGLLCAALLVLSLLAHAQDGDTARWYRFNMDDGSTIIGTITGGSNNVFQVSTHTLGTVDVELDHVVRMVRVTPDGSPLTEAEHPWEEEPPMQAGDTLSQAEAERNAERARAARDSLRWFTDRHASHYFVAPSAIPMKKGLAYYRNTYLAVQSFAIAVTDHLAIGAGFEVLSFYPFARTPPSAYISAKGAWGIGRHLHLGIVGAYVNVPAGFTEGDFFHWETGKTLREGTGSLHGMVTASDQHMQMTVGGGMRYEEWAKNGLGSEVNLSFAARVLPKLWVLTEEWYHTLDDQADDRFWWSLGIRFSTPRTALDVGIVNNSDLQQDLYYGFPFLAFSANIGQR